MSPSPLRYDAAASLSLRHERRLVARQGDPPGEIDSPRCSPEIEGWCAALQIRRKMLDRLRADMIYRFFITALCQITNPQTNTFLNFL